MTSHIRYMVMFLLSVLLVVAPVADAFALSCADAELSKKEVSMDMPCHAEMESAKDMQMHDCGDECACPHVVHSAMTSFIDGHIFIEITGYVPISRQVVSSRVSAAILQPPRFFS